jgi:phosphatidylserine decarboxylase
MITIAVIIILIIIVSFILFFNRSPERKLNVEPAGIVSPADGTVVEVSKHKVAIFLSVFDVHTQYVPVKGVVAEVEEFKNEKGEYLAWDPRVGQNSKVETTIISDIYGEVIVRQIAGALARTCNSYMKMGDKPEQGAKLGRILLGSRVEIKVDNMEGKKFNVKEGDKVVGGETVLVG